MFILKAMLIILFLPGYALMALSYFFPTEWGKRRNTSTTARQWNKKHFFAPLYSLVIYLMIFILGGWGLFITESNENKINSTNKTPRENTYRNSSSEFEFNIKKDSYEKTNNDEYNEFNNSRGYDDFWD
ncbi:MAG: hypothetical protein ACON41_07215 [Parvibaculales bacterium]